MSSEKETIYYMELRAGDAVQDGDQFRDLDGQWKPYTFLAHMGGKVGFGVTARRPIPATGQVTYEEVPGSRTTQETVVQPQRERIAYEELRPGDLIQEGDEWQHECGRWKPFASLDGSCVQVRHTQRARRPYRVSTILEIGDALANAQKAATQLQGERDELKTALRESHAAHEWTMKQGLAACRERDEALAERDRLQEVVGNLYNEPTAKQVQDMLRTWATELDWSAGCFDSPGREQIDTIQKTLVAVIERIEGLVNPEGGTDDN